MQETQVQCLGHEDEEEKMTTYSSILPGKSHGLRNLVGYSLWGHKKSQTGLSDNNTKTNLKQVWLIHSNMLVSMQEHKGNVSK